MKIIPIIILLLIPFVNAASIKLTIDSNIVDEQLIIPFIASNESLTYSFAFEPEYVDVLENSKKADFELNHETLTIYPKDESGEIRILARVSGLIESSGTFSIFHQTLYLDSPAEISLYLPEKAVLSKSNPSVSPKPTSIESDGRQLKISWDVDTAKNGVPLIVVYESPANFLIVGIIILILIILGVGLYTFTLLKKTNKKISDSLTDDEIAIVKLLSKNKDQFQKDVALQLEFSKSKMSKLVARLESRGILRRTPYNKTNKLRLN